MSNIQQHSIQRLIFDSDTDCQTNATILQQIIQRIAAKKIPNIINETFSCFSQPHKITRINQLVIHIKPLPINQFEHQLPLLFKKELVKQLQSYLAIKSTQNNLLSVNEAHTELLSYFLTTGHLPWWKSNLKGSIDELFSGLLTKHPHEIKQLLSSLIKDINVRRRITQQFSDNTIKKIFSPKKNRKKPYFNKVKYVYGRLFFPQLLL